MVHFAVRDHSITCYESGPLREDVLFVDTYVHWEPTLQRTRPAVPFCVPRPGGRSQQYSVRDSSASGFGLHVARTYGNTISVAALFVELNSRSRRPVLD